jgi:hypothetical protein
MEDHREQLKKVPMAQLIAGLKAKLKESAGSVPPPVTNRTHRLPLGRRGGA